MMTRVTRRKLLQGTAALASGYFLGTTGRAVAADSPNEKLNVACIGVGGQGSGHTQAMLKNQNVIAIADVDEVRAGKQWGLVPAAARYRDFRRMFDAVGSKLDAVVISTPDHTHFHPGLMAMQLGLHTYIEKPMTHNVWECRRLTVLAREKKLATQLGVQRHNLENVRRVVELLKSGIIGPVQEVYSWVGGSRGMPEVPKGMPAVPNHLDYDLWVGPANFRPYDPSFCPYGWRFWWDYGTGETGNWGCHILDIPFWALDLKYPTRVDATGPDPDPARTPKSMQVTYTFSARGKHPELTLHWSHGAPAILKERNIKRPGNNLFVGEKGMLLCDFDKHVLLPEEQFADISLPTPFLPKPIDFRTQWTEACKGGAAASCHFDYSGPLTETVLLGNVAYRAGGFSWDAERLQATDNAAAQALIQEPYRKGWEVA